MDIKNDKLNVESAFKNFFYFVPDYQREYVWEEKNINQLLEDIYEEFQANQESEYFIGSIVVCKKEDKKLEVIDGQQRLTTLFLILCAFKKLLKNNVDALDILKQELFEKTLKGSKITGSYKLVLQYEDTAGLLAKISEENNLDGDFKGSARKIVDAYQYILRYLESNFKKEEDLMTFLSYISNKVTLIQIETPSISDALKIFETINERGVGLNPMDLLKNLIFRQVPKIQFDKLKIEWKKIIELLDKNHEKHLRFLRYFIMANYNVRNKRGEEIIREDEIYDWITQEENIKQCDYEKNPFDFVQKIQEDVDAYVKFSKGLDKNGDVNVYLDNIKNLSGSFSQHLILLLSAKDIEKGLFTHLVKQLETLIFYYILTKTPTKELERKFSKWAKEVREISRLKEQKEKLNEFIVRTLIPEISTKNRAFEISFKEFNYKTLQQYRLKYILAKFAKYIDISDKGMNEPDSLDNYLSKKSKIEIEHILPNNPEDELKDDFEKVNGKDSYNVYKLKLGNLTLLDKPRNIAAGRDYFEKKKNIYKTSTILLTKSIVLIENVGKNTSVNRINQQLKSWDKWGSKEIDERQEMLFALSKRIWVVEKE